GARAGRAPRGRGHHAADRCGIRYGGAAAIAPRPGNVPGRRHLPQTTRTPLFAALFSRKQPLPRRARPLSQAGPPGQVVPFVLNRWLAPMSAATPVEFGAVGA